MILLTGADIVLPDQIVSNGSLAIRDGVIQDVLPAPAGRRHWQVIDYSGHTIVPGFVDVHLHGIEGTDVLGGPDAVADVAARLPKYGVTAFCPTSVACTPERLQMFLDAIGRAQASAPPHSARVLGAHLESNFLNADWNGAQPKSCLRLPFESGADFGGDDIQRVIADHRTSVGIVTLAVGVLGMSFASSLSTLALYLPCRSRTANV